jgi:hypothetical protein
MNGAARAIALLATFIATSIACGRSNLDEFVLEPTTTGAAGTGAMTTYVKLPTGVVPLPYVPVTKTVSACWEPEGMPYEPASVAETVSLLVGRWLACGGATPANGATNGHQGMELGRDRHWRAMDLVADELVDAVGYQNEGIWYLSPEDPKDMGALERFLRFKPNGKGAAGVGVTFLQGPTRLLTSDGTVFVWRGE